MSRDAKAASRFRGLLASERYSADLYSGLADAATGERREVLTELAAVERKHAAHWAAKLTELGEPVPPADRPGLRTTVLSWLARRFSVDAVLLHLERAEHAEACIRATRMRPRRWPPTSVPTPQYFNQQLTQAELEAAGARIVPRRDALEIAPGVMTSREIPTTQDFEEEVAVTAAHPRPDFKRRILRAFNDGNKHRPHSTFGNVNADVLEHVDPSFVRDDFVDIIRNNCWPE